MFIRFSMIAAALSLPGCVSVLPDREPPGALYRLGPMQPVHAMDSTVLVREPEASRILGGRRIASEDSTGALRYVRGVEWGESVTHMLQTAMLDRLSGEGSGAAVAAESGIRGSYELTWRVSDFTLLGDTARCRIEAILLDGTGRSLISQKIVESSAVANGSENADRARALTEAGRKCVDEIADFVAEQTKATVPPAG